MPRKRKEAPDTVEDSEPTAKRSRTSLEVKGHEVHWQWEDDGGKWTSYSSEHATIITDACRTHKKDVTFDVAPTIQMKIVFDRMVQKNKKTGWERRLRFALRNDTNTDFHIWQWEDEHKRWNPYNVTASFAIEMACVDGEDEVVVEAAKRQYTINLRDSEQVNNSTNVTRKIENLTIDVDDKAMQVPTASDIPTTSSTADQSEAGKGRKSAAKGSTGRGKSTGSKSAGSKATSPEEEGAGDVKKSSVRTFVKKGAAPVDPECTAKVNTAHVYSQGKNVYDVMLNQTNLSNNNNKYYLMQVLEDDSRKVYSVWYRWGRVGYKGQTTLIPCGPDLNDAIDTFTKKFQDKTKNDWSSRNKFQKVSGKYDLVTVDYNAENESEEAPKTPDADVPDSKLEKRLQSLIDLICDVKKMEAAVMEMKYDAKKAPLGKLTDKQIKAGYTALKKIDNYINANDFGSKLIQACDDFYTRIPHDFGMQRPPVIRTKAELRLKLSLLEALGDIEIAMKIIKESKVDENPLDTHYNSLKCDISSLDKTMADYKMVEDYLQNTHATTHNQYKMEIMDIYEVNKGGQDKNFVDKGNRMMLWHGSRLTNWVGILSQGLRIAPPEAPVTGYMFGKGAYFADMSSKSANYCYPSQGKNEGLVLLCDVSLGKCNELLSADYNAASMPAGCHSVMGKGKIAPNPKKNFTTADGCVVPLGKAVDTGVKNPNGYTLNYNEFIVYDLNQIKMKYLLRVKFNFK